MHIMSQTAAKPALDTKALVLAEIRERPIRPTDLLRRLQERSKVTEDQIKTALAALIESYVVELSPDRYLRISSKKSGA
jgi:hypothetical protein